MSTSLDDIRTEVRVMKICKHENVLPLFCAFVPKHGAELWLVTPLMDKGMASISAIEPVVLDHYLFHDAYGGLDEAIISWLAIHIHPP